MIAIFFLLNGFLLTLIQTSLLPHFPISRWAYDLLIPLVLYMILFHPLRISLPAVLAAGFLMDSLSVGPFGVYLSTYLWLLAAGRWLSRFLHTGNRLLIPFLIAGGVLLENLFFFATFLLSGRVLEPPPDAMFWIFEQTFGALITGGIFLAGFVRLDRLWNKWIARLSERNT